MKTSRLILFSYLFFKVSSLFCLPFEMILTGDPILEDLRYLSLESGKSIVSLTPPIAPAEIGIFLNSIDPSLLSKTSREAYDRIQKKLLPGEDPLSISSENFSALVNLNFTLEGRLRINTDIEWYPQYPKIPPLFSFPINLFFADSLQLYIEPILTVVPRHYLGEKTLAFNAPYDYGDFDASLMHRAFIAAGGSWWNFQLGRDRLFWGTGHMGSLTFSDNSAYFEYARLSFFSRIAKYSFIVNQLPLQIRDRMYIGNPLQPGDLDAAMQRNFYLHRFDFNFRNFLSVGIMEGLVVGNSPLEIRYLNPLMVFHSFFSGFDYERWPGSPDMGHMNGSFLSIEANWSVIKSLSVYGQFVMNEVAFPGVETDPSPPPNGFGFMAGADFSRSFDVWASSFFLECIYTFPYLYMNSSPFSSFIQMHKVSSGSDYRYYFLGYPRDTFALTLGANFFKNDVIHIEGELSWLSRGEHATNDLLWDWKKERSAYDERTPSGTPENNYIVAVEAKWKPYSFLTFNGSLAGIFSQNNRIVDSDTAGVQATFSVSCHY